MPRFVLVTDSPRHSHACHVTRDEIAALIRDPLYGYSDVPRCMAMIEACPEATGTAAHVPFPLHPAPWGTSTIYVEGVMDLEASRFRKPCEKCGAMGKPCAHRRAIQWMEPGHRCDLRCLIGLRGRAPR